MPAADWTEMTDILTSTTLRADPNVTVPRPPGGGQYVFAMNTIQTPGGGGGAYGRYHNGVGFVPVSGESASMEGVIKRYPSGGTTGRSVWLFVMADSSSVNSRAYVLGLSDATQSHIVLKKCDAVYAPAGLMSAGIPDLAPDPASNGILMRSTATYPIDTWVHLRLDAILQPDNSVLLQVFSNDLDVNPIGSSPVWTPIPGMEGPQATVADGPFDGFMDDVSQIATGTAPIPSGRVGWGAHFTDIVQRVAIDGGATATRA